MRFGITPEKLIEPHESRPWNPLIAHVFYRAGIIEEWGTGTLNILDWCQENASPPPIWSEQPGAVVVTFSPAVPLEPVVRSGAGQRSSETGSEPESQPESQPESLANRVLGLLDGETLSKAGLSTRLGQRAVSGPLNAVIRQLLREGLIEYTLPDKPNSRLQQYRLTTAGRNRCDRDGGKRRC